MRHPAAIMIVVAALLPLAGCGSPTNNYYQQPAPSQNPTPNQNPNPGPNPGPGGACTEGAAVSCVCFAPEEPCPFPDPAACKDFPRMIQSFGTKTCAGGKLSACACPQNPCPNQ